MLIPKRRVGQFFWIMNEIQVILLGQCNGIIRIGIEAPREYHIVRHEITFEGVSEKHD